MTYEYVAIYKDGKIKLFTAKTDLDALEIADSYCKDDTGRHIQGMLVESVFKSITQFIWT